MLENLKAATFEIFETMFFLFPESWEEGQMRFAGAGLMAWTPVTGPKSFHIGLVVPQSLAQKMAKNFLGLGEGGPEWENLEDLLQEAANMVAGTFLSREQVSQSYRLALPHSARINFDVNQWQPHDQHLLFMVDDHGLEVFLERTS
jgi:hypothetical protein|uniref:Chemotaxis phosphatase CheX-like domain-containing protein n=1 Tax=Desulfobacca acetoxidans TaxID=60893 RepID=A0A7C3WLC6_9BACT